MLHIYRMPGLTCNRTSCQPTNFVSEAVKMVRMPRLYVSTSTMRWAANGICLEITIRVCLRNAQVIRERFVYSCMRISKVSRKISADGSLRWIYIPSRRCRHTVSASQTFLIAMFTAFDNKQWYFCDVFVGFKIYDSESGYMQRFLPSRLK